jgi:hypothetical protein
MMSVRWILTCPGKKILAIGGKMIFWLIAIAVVVFGALLFAVKKFS